MDIMNAYRIVSEKIELWIRSLIIMLPNIIVAVVIIILFYFLAKLLKKFINRILNKISPHIEINSIITSILFISIIGVGFFIALGVLQLDEAVISLLAGVGIIGLALGFAFQDMAANFISGIAIAIRHPYKVNDIIESNDFFGTVKKINLRTTDILTLEGQLALIPNKEVFQKPLINHSLTGLRRADLKVGISYGEDLDKVKKITLDSVKEISIRDLSREPEFFYEEFGDSSINFSVRLWIHYSIHKDYKRAISEMVERIKKAYDANEITIPFPIRTLDFGIKGGEKLSETVIAIRKNGEGKLE